jgi:zinc and cadmium transporter
MLLYAILATLAVSLVSLVGIITLSASSEKLKKISFYLVGLAAGTMIGDVFIHLLPEAVELAGEKIWKWIIIGIALFFILEKIIHWRHCHILTSSEHPHPLGTMNLVGDIFHNFFDGLLIGGSFLISIPVGLATTLAVLLHEIPQEIGDFGVLLHAGYSKTKALTFNFLSALTSVIGAIAIFFIGEKIEQLNQIIMPLTAGAFLYIAMADLLPELHRETKLKKSLLQLTLLGSGLLIMYLLKIYFA